MFSLFRILILSILVFLLVIFNRENVEGWIFGATVTLQVRLIILGSVIVGIALSRWYENYRQISLLDIIKEYSKKVSALEKALADKEKEEKR